MFVSDFEPCTVFAVDLDHFAYPLKQLARVWEQSGVPDRTSEAHLRPFQDEIQPAARPGFGTAGRAEVALFVDEEVVCSLGHQAKRCSVLYGRCGSFARPVQMLREIRGRVAAAMLVHAICLAQKPAH